MDNGWGPLSQIQLDQIKPNMRKIFHYWVVKKLIGGGCFTAKDINTQKRTIYCGMFGLKTIFVGPKEQFYLSVLVKWYRYQLLEGTIRPTATWGEPFENVQNRYEQFRDAFNDEIEQRKNVNNP